MQMSYVIFEGNSYCVSKKINQVTEYGLNSVRIKL